MNLRSLILPTIVAGAVAVAALGLGHSRGGAASTTSHGPSSAIPHLTIANYAFSPATLTVRAGTTITVTNTDSTSHTATARSGAFDSGTLKPGQSAHFTLRTPGTYIFYCQFHAFMTGTIKVTR
jgi:plastocyanin